MTDDPARTGAIGLLADRPRYIMWVCLGAITLSAWVYLSLISPQVPSGGFLLIDMIKTICGPQSEPWSAKALFWVFVMWSAMSLAMMLPTASPMISTYADIAGAAAEKNMEAVSPLVLAAGYLVVWLVFSGIATLLQAGLQSGGLLNAKEALNDPVLAGLVLVGAGAYQFTSLKHNCLTKCRQPMPFFLANWSEKTFDIFKIGLMQGLYCLGCCWALMAVMFVSGLMNLAWMAVVAVIMVLEKTLADARLITYGLAGILILAGIWLMVQSLFVN